MTAYSFDASMNLSDPNTSYSASGFSQVAGAAGFINFGGGVQSPTMLPLSADQSLYTPGAARIAGVAVIDLNLIDVDSGDELYKLMVLGSNDFNFGAGVQLLGMLQLGAAAVLEQPNPFATPAAGLSSRYELFFCTEQNGVTYRYARLWNKISGTSPIISYGAFVAVLPAA